MTKVSRESCPLCGSFDVYISLTTLECPTPGCRNYSFVQACEVASEQMTRRFEDEYLPILTWDDETTQT